MCLSVDSSALHVAEFMLLFSQVGYRWITSVRLVPRVFNISICLLFLRFGVMCWLDVVYCMFALWEFVDVNINNKCFQMFPKHDLFGKTFTYFNVKRYAIVTKSICRNEIFSRKILRTINQKISCSPVVPSRRYG